MASIASGLSSVTQIGVSASDALTRSNKRAQFIVNHNTVCVFDLQKSETYKYSAKATRFPTENATDITDHVLVEPFTLSMECFLTDTPSQSDDAGKKESSSSAFDKELVSGAATTALSALAGPLGVVAAAAGTAAYNLNPQFGDDGKISTTKNSRSMTGYYTLRSLFLSKALIDVQTKLDLYKNMVIEELSVPRDPAIGDALTFSISLVHINIVTSQTVAASDLANAALSSGAVQVGDQQAENVDPEPFHNRYPEGRRLFGRKD